MLAPCVWGKEVVSDIWLSLRWLLVFWGTGAERGLFSTKLVAEPGRANSHPWCGCPGAVRALLALQSPGHCALPQHCCLSKPVTDYWETWLGVPRGCASCQWVPVGWGCFQCRRKMMLIHGLIDGTVTDDYSSYNSRQQSCPVCLSMSSSFRHYRKYGVVEMNPSHLSSPRAHSCCHVLLQGWCIHECPLLPANTHQQHPAVVQHRGQAESMGHERRSDAGTLWEKAALFMSM